MNPAGIEKEPMFSTARALVDRLRAAGHIAYFAGGCVRDLVRGQVPKDIDIATDARPEEVQKIFRRTYAVGAHFGVIVVLENRSAIRSRDLSVPTAFISMDATQRKCTSLRRKKTRAAAISPSTACSSIRLTMP